MAGIASVTHVVLDTVDPERLVGFWSELLGVEVIDRAEEGQYVVMGSQDGVGPRFALQRVPEAKAVKNRIHLDMAVDDLDEATARIEALGGRRVEDVDHDLDGYIWRSMADPEGNEFDIARA
jgi:predicted enzyme related to lactoylglutathione lyase